MFTVEKNKNTFIVSIFNNRRLNLLVSGQVKKQLVQFLDLPGTTVVLNLNGVEFIDSHSFEMLREVSSMAKEASCVFKLINLSKNIKELIELVGFCEAEVVV